MHLLLEIPLTAQSLPSPQDHSAHASQQPVCSCQQSQTACNNPQNDRGSSADRELLAQNLVPCHAVHHGSPPSALNIMPMSDSSSGGQTLYLHIGLQSGVYLRTVLDEVSGELSDTRTRFLGPQPVRLFRVWVKGQQVILALSSRPWLAYSDPQTMAFTLTPLDYVPPEWAWSFSSVQFPEGIVAIQGPNLR